MGGKQTGALWWVVCAAWPIGAACNSQDTVLGEIDGRDDAAAPDDGGGPEDVGTEESPEGLADSELPGAMAEIAARGRHTCIRRVGGTVECWGHNMYGELGTGGTGAAATAAVDVVGLTDAVELAAGHWHTCARRAGGTVVCWGLNEHGQLGDGTTTDRHAPVEVVGLTDAVALGSGEWHTCAQRSSGAWVCWGLNDHGQLGDGTTTDRHAPVEVSGIGDAVELVGGGFHTCARREAGTVVCWGANDRGQLGDGTTETRSDPVTVVGLTDAVQLTASGEESTGGHSCARRETGEIVCWGANDNGQLGDGTTTDRPVPVAVTGITDAIDVAAGGGTSAAAETASGHTCALREMGTVCWGEGGRGQLGNATMLDSSTPAWVESLGGGHQRIVAGSRHTCVFRVLWPVQCWGANSDGQLGNGSLTEGEAVPGNVLGTG